MTNHPLSTVVRRAARILAIVPALAVTMLAGAAVASPPEQWEDNAPVSPLYVLLVLGAIPVGLFVLITLLAYLPSMSKDASYHPGEVWRGEPEWFGGPRGGLEAVDSAAQPAAIGSRPSDGGAADGSGHPTTGGTSASW